MHRRSRAKERRHAAPRWRLLRRLSAAFARRGAVRALRNANGLRWRRTPPAGRGELEACSGANMKGVYGIAIAALAAYTGGAVASHRRDALAVRTYVHERDIWLDTAQWRVIRAELFFSAARWPLGPPHPVAIADKARARGPERQ